MSEGKSAEQKVSGGGESKKIDPEDTENVGPEWAGSNEVGTPSGHQQQTITLTAGYVCDGCNEKIQDHVWHCEDCVDYDLCEACYDKGVVNGAHQADHKLTIKDLTAQDDTVLDIADLLAPPKNQGLVHKLMQFVDKAMVEWEPFFEETIDVFDQEWDDLHNAGETLEQYAAFNKYEKLVSEKFDDFAQEEGFDSIGDCFEEIQRLVAEDKVKLEEELAQMRANMKRTHDEWEAKKRQAQAHAEGKAADAGDGGEAKAGEGKTADGGGGGGGGGGGSGEGKAADAAEDLVGQAFVAGIANATKAIELPKAPGQEEAPPMFLIFHRMGLEQVVEMVCNLADYKTFSMMMRMRVEQRRWSKMIQEMMAANKAAQEAEGDGGGGAGGGGGDPPAVEFEILADDDEGGGGEGYTTPPDQIQEGKS